MSKKARNAKGTGLRLIKNLMKQKWRLLIVFISVICASAFNLIAPKVVGQAINVIFDGIQETVKTESKFLVNLESMGTIIFTLLALYLCNAMFIFIQQHVMASVAQNLTLSLREQVSEKLNKLPIRYFDNHKKGDILSRVTSDLERVADTIQEGLAQLISSVIGVVGAFVMMLLISPMLTLIVLSTIIASLIIAALVSNKTQKAYRDNQQALGALNGSIEESFTGNNIIKTFNLEESVIRSTEELNERLFDTGTRAQFMTYAINPMIRLLNQLGYVVIAIRGGISVLQGRITIGDIQAFFQYVQQVSEPITQVAYIVNMLQGAIASAERVYEILDEENEIQDTEVLSPEFKPVGNVKFENVRFGYSNENILMENISIDVKAGSKVAIVGPTGAGKTTLVNLLMRFYEIFDGKIIIDGVEITRMKRDELRSMIGMVLQDTWLFSGTIKDNIAYGNKNVSYEEIVQASKVSRVDHFIRTMPEGYETVLDGESTSISQGQKQLLTIARAILADPTILILDEATSSVDTRTELEIQKAMNQLMKGRTSFIIAHRLSTIRDADLILVMDNGTIVEQGTHDELINLGKFYFDLYNSQFSKKVIL